MVGRVKLVERREITPPDIFALLGDILLLRNKI